MGRQVSTKCDECGTEKKETNHWFQVAGSETRPVFRTAAADDADVLMDLCGQFCTMVVFQRWMDTGRVLSAERRQAA